ncbi:MAG TPA: hypothetical protein VI299_18150 [Polyangiales bacterium]
MRYLAMSALLMCSACHEETTRDMDGGAVVLPARLADSLESWQALAAANPGPYWYEEENCLVNSSTGSSSIVQVEDNVARVVGSKTFPRSECKALVNRYGGIAGFSGGPPTLPGLHDVCAALMKRRDDVKVAFGAEGVVRECWVGTSPGCSDNCGEGFFLLRRGFGLAPLQDAGVGLDGG